jgi:hypothetical protein
VPGRGLRGVLRDRFNIEAAIGSFKPSKGHLGAASDGKAVGCVRLSHAVYNHRGEYEALRDAVLELAEEASR